MKKTRLLAFLITVCLATTCFLSGTVAKYSTSDAAADQGTVAKWGIQLNITGSLFGEKYTNGSGSATEGIPTVSTTDTAYSVAVENTGKNVVAPGTNSEKPINVSLKGTAETDLKITFNVTGANLKDIYLAAGTYYIMATENVTSATFDGLKATLYTENTGTYTKLADDAIYKSTETYYKVKETVTVASGGYRPVVYTLKNNGDSTSANYTTVTALIDALQKVVTGNTTTKTLNANAKDFETGINYDITWKWEFQNTTGTDEEKANQDNCDTILGLLIAGQTNVVKTTDSGETYVQLVSGTDYNTETAFNFEIKVEQVD